MSYCNPDLGAMSIKFEPLFYDIILHMQELGVDLTASEKQEMQRSDDYHELAFDFIPMQHSETWFNVRIYCMNYSIIAISNHPGFNA